MLAVALHGLHWLIGACVLRRALGPCPLRPGRGPHWIAAWAIGLALHVVVAFTLGQLLGLTLSPWLLATSAVGVLAVAALALRAGPRPALVPLGAPAGAADAPDAGWTWPAAALLCVAVVVFARLHGAMLWAPFQDWDSFLYHLPYGRLVADGAFPDDIAPDYAHVAAAYPPLFYFLYGLNFHLVDTVGALDLTYVMPKATVTMINGLSCLVVWSLARARLQLGRVPAAWAVLWVVLLLNWKANIQSVTVLYFTLALYYAWPEAPAPGATRGEPGVGPVERGALPWLPGALLLAGCAWSNYTGLFLAAAFLAGHGIAVGARRDRPAVTTWMLCSVVVGGLLAPFLLRNWIVAGNPVFPAALDWLGGVGATPWWLENEGVLRNAPVTRATPALAFHDARGAAPLLLAALGALVVTRRLGHAARLAIATTFVAFAGIWLAILQPTWAMAWRHLQPIVPLAAVVTAAQLDAARSTPVGPAALGLLAWPGLVALTALAPQDSGAFAACVTAVLAWPLACAALERRVAWRPPHAFAIAASAVAALLMAAALDLDTVSRRHAPRWIVPPWPDLLLPAIAGALAAGVARALRRGHAKGAAGLRGRELAALAGGLALIGLATLDGPREPTAYRLDIRADLEWMNRNLPRDAVVLTLEDRLFTLERAHVQASHYGLEAFYTAPDPEASLAELDRLGVTHVYHTRSPIFRRQAFYWRKRLLFPGPDNPYVELVHRSPTGAVVAIRRAR